MFSEKLPTQGRNRQASEEQYKTFLDKSTQTGCQKYLEGKEIVFNTS